MDALLNSIKNHLTEVSITIGVIAFVIVGILIMVKSGKKEGLRDSLSSVGGVGLGLFICGAGAILAPAIYHFAEGLG